MDEEYVCDRCERRFPITQVTIDGDTVLCGACLPVEQGRID